MSSELHQNLLNLIQCAVDLANSVKDDIKENRSISDTTIILLNQFQIQHDDLDTVLDIANEIN